MEVKDNEEKGRKRGEYRNKDRKHMTNRMKKDGKMKGQY